MERHRVLLAFGIAWFSALLLSWWVYQKSTAPQKREVVQAVAAARDLPVGKRLAPADLKLVVLDRKDVPQGAALRIADLVDRSVIVLVAANELVLERKLAGKGSGEGLTALIEPGMRAVSVQVNETSGVAGFAQPGSRVDVLFTRVAASGDAATTTILQNIKVIAYGRQLEPGGKLDTRTSSGQTVATLLVTQEQAEKLALAVQRGRIQLALRNPLDNELTEETEPVRTADLGMDDEPAARRARTAVPPESGNIFDKPVAGRSTANPGNGPKPQNDGRIVVKIFRGSKVSEEVFQ